MSTINVTLPDLPYAVEEALNRLRVNIKFCGKNTKKILIASSVENEGKTFVAIHLWHMLAEAGFPTVLVDTDLRKSVLKSRFQFQSDDEIISKTEILCRARTCWRIRLLFWRMPDSVSYLIS